MRKNKKIFSMLLSVLMLFTVVPFYAYAADPKLSVSGGTQITLAYNESDFRFDVSLDGAAQDFASVVFDVTYDKSILKLSSVHNNASGYDVKYESASDQSSVTLTIGSANGENSLSGGVNIAGLEFAFVGSSNNTAKIILANAKTVRIIDGKTAAVETTPISGSVTVTVAKESAVTPTPDPTSTPIPTTAPTPAPAPTDNSSGSGSGTNGSTSDNRTPSAAPTPQTISLDNELLALGAPLVSEVGVEISYDGNGYINGFPDGTVHPDESLTRGQMAVMLYMLVSNKEHTGTVAFHFSDLDESQYNYEAITFFAGHGILSGYPDGTFKAGSSITRAEAATILSAFVAENPNAETALNFEDLTGHWAQAYIQKLVRSGCISGYPDGTFRPDNQITRAEIITLINKALSIDSKTLSQRAENRFTDLDKSHWAYKDIVSVTISN